MQMATDTPIMLPVPTREAVDTISAWKEDTLPSFSGRSTTTRMASRQGGKIGLPQQPQLREPVPNGEKQSGGHQQNHQQVGIHPVAQIRNDLSQHVCISLLFNVGEWSGNRFNQPE